MARKWHEAKVIAIEDMSQYTRKYFLKCEGEIFANFKPGQFITLDLPIHEKRTQRWKSYSIANLPTADHPVIELCIVYLEGGLASEYLFNQVKIGDSLTFKGPAGVFTYPEQNDLKMVMVCTGTGIAPFRSMLKYLNTWESWPHDIHLIFGTRTEDGILYREELEELAATNEHFAYDVALSRDPDWNGHKGYVHTIYEEYYPDASEDVLFYICGWTAMVDEARQRLENLGYTKQQVRFELYG